MPKTVLVYADPNGVGSWDDAISDRDVIAAVESLELESEVSDAISRSHLDRMRTLLEAQGFEVREVAPSEVETEIARGALRRNDIYEDDPDDCADGPVLTAWLLAWEDVDSTAIARRIVAEHGGTMFDLYD